MGKHSDPEDQKRELEQLKAKLEKEGKVLREDHESGQRHARDARTYKS